MDLFVGIAGVIFLAAGFCYAIWLWIKDIFRLEKDPGLEAASFVKPRPVGQTATPAHTIAATNASAKPVTFSGVSGSTWLAVGIAALLLLAVLPLPIGFYMILR